MFTLSLPVGQALKKAWSQTENASLAITGLALTMGVLSPVAYAQGVHINHPQGIIVTATPEPSSWIAFAIGGLGLLFLARIARKRRMSE